MEKEQCDVECKCLLFPYHVEWMQTAPQSLQRLGINASWRCNRYQDDGASLA